MRSPFVHVHAGFPSPAEGHLEAELDANDYLVRNPRATFFAKVSGTCMEGAGVNDGDVVVVDRSYDPRDGDMVTVVIDDHPCVRRMTRIDGVPHLECVPADGTRVPDPVRADVGDIAYWGAVVGLMRRTGRSR